MNTSIPSPSRSNYLALALAASLRNAGATHLAATFVAPRIERAFTSNSHFVTAVKGSRVTLSPVGEVVRATVRVEARFPDHGADGVVATGRISYRKTGTKWNVRFVVSKLS